MKKDEKVAQSVLAQKRKKRQTLDDKKTVTLLAKRIETLEEILQATVNFKISPSIIQPYDNGESESTAFALLSDIHFEEVVRPETVMGFNSYNREIATKRLNQYFVNVVKLVEKEQQSSRIDKLVLAILGDLISGYIHDTLMELTWAGPAESLLAATNEIAGGINYILNNTSLQLDVICHSGNHGRTQKELHIGNEYENSLETIAYQFLSQRFSGNDRVKFFIPKSYLSYYTVYNFTVALHHGHFVRYNGGVGGVTIPMNKAVASWQKLRHADLYCSGHWHTFFDGGNFIINGSVIGYSAYALSVKAAYEPPRQAFFLINKKWNCKTVVCPILFDI